MLSKNFLGLKRFQAFRSINPQYGHLKILATALMTVVISSQLLNSSVAEAAEILGTDSDTVIQGEYIVVLKRPELSMLEQTYYLSSAVDDAEYNVGVEVIDRYDRAVLGFAVSASDEEIEALADDERVDYIQANETLTLNAIQQNPTWGLDRIDSRSSSRNHQYYYNYNGAGVHAYIIDSGILTTHQDFGGRVASTNVFVTGGVSGLPEDCVGHGSHVAGIVGGKRFGVAKEVTLHNVRIAGCGNIRLNDLLAGINWVIHNAQRPAVVNFSIGSKKTISEALDDAVSAVVESGITMVVAAGNDTYNACLSSASSVPTALAVGAMDINNNMASFSNYGSCVDVLAPGKDILSVGVSSNTATQTYSGTSMAAPHVTGAVALILQQYGNISPAAVERYIRENSTRNMIGNLRGNTPNRLLFSDVAWNTYTRLRHTTYSCPPTYSQVAKIFQIHAGADGYNYTDGPQDWRVCSKWLNGQPTTLLKYAPTDCPSGYNRIAYLGAVVAQADGFDQSDGAKNWSLCSLSRGQPLTRLKHSSNDCDFSSNYHRIAWLGGIHAGADGYGYGDGPQNWALCAVK